MRHRRLGRSGLTVSTLALGTWAWGNGVSEEAARDLLRGFVDGGGTLVDTANGFGGGAAESLLGRLLGSAVDRDDVLLATKAGVSPGPGGAIVDLSRGALLRRLDESLRRLGTEVVDIWMAHTFDPSVPLEETLGALEYAVTSGRARYVGVSNFAGWQAARASSLLESARIPLVVDQVAFSLADREAEHEILPAAAYLGFGVLGYSPLARGVLTGKYRSGTPADSGAADPRYAASVASYLDERTVGVTESVAAAARGLGVSQAEVALAWARDVPAVTGLVIGPRTLGHLRAALASDSLTLPREIRAALDDVSE